MKAVTTVPKTQTALTNRGCAPRREPPQLNTRKKEAKDKGNTYNTMPKGYLDETCASASKKSVNVQGMREGRVDNHRVGLLPDRRIANLPSPNLRHRTPPTSDAYPPVALGGGRAARGSHQNRHHFHRLHRGGHLPVALAEAPAAKETTKHVEDLLKSLLLWDVGV